MAWIGDFIKLYEAHRVRLEDLDTRRLSLMAVLAAVYAVGSYLPGFPMLGLPGSKIDLVRALEIGYGVALGPVYGPVTAFLGALAGKTLTGGGVGLFFTPLAPVTAFTASMLARRGGWRYSAAVVAALVLGWYCTPVGRSAWVATALHLGGLLVVLVLRDRIGVMVSSGDRRRLALGLFLCSLPSTLAGHLLGNIIFAVLFSPSPEFFVAILPVSAVERLVISVLAAVFGSSLVVAIRQLYPSLLE